MSALSRMTLRKNSVFPEVLFRISRPGAEEVDAIELAQLAKLYQRPVAWFTGEDPNGATDKIPEEVAHVARAAASLSQQDRQELARFADFLKSRARTKAGSDGR